MTTPAHEARLLALKAASRRLRSSTTDAKNAALERAAQLLGEPSNLNILLHANDEDMRDARAAMQPAAFLDRLQLDRARVALMADSLRQVARLPDPVGEVAESRALANGLKVSRVRAPLGVILMIFESRPNVATEAFSLAFKAGNVVILRGGKESMRTTGVLYAVLGQALAESGLPADCLWGVTEPDRELTAWLLKQKQAVDIVVPRGGAGLIEYVVEKTRIPIIKNDRGLCHIYVHDDADLEMAADIVLNAKVQRPGVCNSMETLLVNEAVAGALIPRLHALLTEGSSGHPPRHPVKWHGCPRTLRLLAGREGVHAASPADWDTEYLDYEMNCLVVDRADEAFAHIERHGSRHSEAILTASRELALRFQDEIDAAAVYWNASTRFTDGYELGLGGELGISTQKLHVRGPVGLRELTSLRWIMEGTGQIRK